MVDTRGDDCSLMNLIGHQLQHTVEGLSNPTVRVRRPCTFFTATLTLEGFPDLACRRRSSIKGDKGVLASFFLSVTKDLQGLLWIPAPGSAKGTRMVALIPMAKESPDDERESSVAPQTPRHES